VYGVILYILLIWINTQFNDKNVKHIFHTFSKKTKWENGKNRYLYTYINYVLYEKNGFAERKNLKF